MAAVLLAMTSPGAVVASERLAVGGAERSYSLFRPEPAASKPQPLPLVVALHGGGGTGTQLQTWLGMDPVAAREGFAVVYPDALDRSWNDGRGDLNRRRHAGNAPDDVAFLSALVRRLSDQGIADPGRVFVTGVSNGGMMTYRLACETDGLYAGYAAVIANLSTELAASCKPAGGRPMLIMNGTADSLVPWAGGPITVLGQQRGTVVSAPATFDFWQKANGCKGAAAGEKLPDRVRDDGSTVEVARATGCSAEGATLLYRVAGGGHQIPRLVGPSRPLLARFLGPANRDIEAAEEIWRFFASLGPQSLSPMSRR